MSQVAETLEKIATLMERDELAPDPARNDWAWSGTTLLGQARERLQADLLAGAGSQPADVRQAIADVTGMVAAASWASGDKKGALELLAQAARLAEGEGKAGFEAALRDPRAFVMLAHAMWLERHLRKPEGRALRERVAVTSKEAVLVRAALPEGLPAHLPRPRPPTGREGMALPLILLLSAIVGVFFWQARERRPAKRVQKAHAAALVLEEQGKREEALREQEALLDDYDERVSPRVLEPVAIDAIRLILAAAPEQRDAPGALAGLRRAVDRFTRLPEPVQNERVAVRIVDRALAWSQLPDPASRTDLARASEVLDLVIGLPGGDKALAERRTQITRRLADALRADEPLAAFSRYVTLEGDAEALTASTALALDFVDEPSVLRELDANLRSWLRLAKLPAGHTAITERVEAALHAALAAADDPARLALLAGNGGEALVAAAAAAPHDQQLVLAVARAQAAAGQLDVAIATLDALGPPGRMVAEVRLAHARLTADRGDLEGADRLATGLVDAWRTRELGGALLADAHLLAADVKLRRAAAATGPARQTLLDEAEAALLAVGEAERTSPAYQQKLAAIRDAKLLK